MLVENHGNLEFQLLLTFYWFSFDLLLDYSRWLRLEIAQFWRNHSHGLNIDRFGQHGLTLHIAGLQSTDSSHLHGLLFLNMYRVLYIPKSFIQVVSIDSQTRPFAKGSSLELR